jgi:hypothetical protein
MPLEDVTITVVIGTHTDSLPLNGPSLAAAIRDAIEDYKAREHQPVEIVECRSVNIDGEEWLVDAGRPGATPGLPTPPSRCTPPGSDPAQ